MIETETIAAVGELDVASAGPLRDAILATTAPTVIVDASGLTFIDSTGLSALLETKDRLTAQDRVLRVINRPRVLNRLLDIAGLGEEFL